MKKELIKIVDNAPITVPRPCAEAIEKNFGRAINIEWQKTPPYFEAIFYQDDLEFIALFEADGTLVEYRKIIPEGYLPFAIRQLVLDKGEIMNRVLVNQGNELYYEVIYRDTALNRFMLLFNDKGSIIKKLPL